ncbi:MAG TPA: HAD family phosphatase [Mycobacteriales bacterium]
MTAPKALILDYGGVLTGNLGEALAAWLAADDIDPADFGALMREWLAAGPGANPIHGLELGSLPNADFEARLAGRLFTRSGAPVAADGLLARMFASFGEEPDMYALLLRARQAGVRTALLSNSWGNDYPRDQFAALFDVAVISGEVRLRKPDPEIYLLTARHLGVEPAECVFVDDLPPNVAGAADVGMIGIVHVDAATTIAEVEAIFGWEPVNTAATG